MSKHSFKEKTVTGTVVQSATYPYTRITDELTNSAAYAEASGTGLGCLTVDLGDTYNLGKVALWGYWVTAK